jgi:hypothetical protein
MSTLFGIPRRGKSWIKKARAEVRWLVRLAAAHRQEIFYTDPP